MGTGTALIVGVGSPAGLGATLTGRFAREGLEVVIAGRTASRLAAVSSAIAAAGGKARPVIADATREGDIEHLFASAGAAKNLELVVFNVGSNVARPGLGLDAGLFEELWRQNALAGFLVGQAAVQNLLERRRGTLLFTGATASLRARPPFTAFASAKAALRAVAQGLAREFGPQGIHVAHIVIDGVIDGDYARRNFPDFVRQKGDDGLLAREAIADTYWNLHRQAPSAWTHELDLRPFKEPF